MWKGKIQAGQSIATPAIMTDWLPTFAAISEGSIPNNITLDGKDISPLLFKGEDEEERDLYFYFNEDLRAIRSGKWKYKKAVLENPYRQKLEEHDDLLFNLEEDPNETNNLASAYPDTLNEMKQKMQDFIQSLRQVPEPKLKEVPFDDPRKKAKL